MNIDKSLKVITKGAFIVLVGLFFSKIFSYLFKVIIARIGTEEFGLFSLGVAVVNLVMIFSILGLDNGIIRYVSYLNGKNDFRRIKGALKFVKGLTFPLSLVMTILIFILSPWISSNIFDKPELTTIIRILSLTIPFIIMREIFLSSLKALKLIKYEVYSKNLVDNGLKVIFSALFLVLGFGMIGIVFAYLFAAVISFILSWVYFRKAFRFIKGVLKPIFINQKILYYSLPLIFSGFANTLMTWTDTLMLGIFRGATEVGVYNAALNTAQLMYIIPYALMSLFFPVLNELHSQNKEEELKRVYQIATKWILSINIIPLVMFLMFSGTLLSTIFSQEYFKGSVALMILATGYFLNYITISSYYTLLTFNKSKIVSGIIISTTFINIILNLLFIPSFGINGAALATTISLIIMGGLWYISCYKITAINSLTTKSKNILVSGIISFILIYFIKSLFKINIFNMILISISFFMIFLSMLLITRALEKEDYIILKSIKNKMLRRYS